MLSWNAAGRTRAASTCVIKDTRLELPYCQFIIALVQLLSKHYRSGTNKVRTRSPHLQCAYSLACEYRYAGVAHAPPPALSQRERVRIAARKIEPFPGRINKIEWQRPSRRLAWLCGQYPARYWRISNTRWNYAVEHLPLIGLFFIGVRFCRSLRYRFGTGKRRAAQPLRNIHSERLRIAFQNTASP